MAINIGDKVRFLSDVGGGVVRGFQKGNIVLVEDEDGFEIPVPAKECVVIETNALNIAKPAPAPPKVTLGAKPSQTASQVMAEPKADAGLEWDERPVTYRPKPEERKDGDRLNVCLSFVPANVKELSKTTFEAYIVNDCNYYVAYTFMSAENAVWKLRSSGVIEPNTKVFLDELGHKDLNEWERLAVQLIAYKEDKPFAMKPAVSTDLRIDITKFYKLHTFRESLFFDEPTLEYYIVKDDVPARPLVVSPEEIKRAMYDKGEDERRQKTAARVGEKRPDPNAVVEVDLHIDELLDTTAGMSPAEIKEYQLGVFRKTMDAQSQGEGTQDCLYPRQGRGSAAQRARYGAQA